MHEKVNAKDSNNDLFISAFDYPVTNHLQQGNHARADGVIEVDSINLYETLLAGNFYGTCWYRIY